MKTDWDAMHQWRESIIAENAALKADIERLRAERDKLAEALRRLKHPGLSMVEVTSIIDAALEGQPTAPDDAKALGFALYNADVITSLENDDYPRLERALAIYRKRQPASAPQSGQLLKAAKEWLDAYSGNSPAALVFAEAALKEAIAAAEQAGPSPVDELLDALKPFAAYGSLPAFNVMPDEHVISRGSELAARQLTAGDCKKAHDVLTKYGRADKQGGDAE